MWNLFLIFAAKHPFLITFAPLISTLLFFRFLKLKMFKICLLYAGLFISLATGIFLHIRWDSFRIHFSEQIPIDLREKKILFIGDSVTCEGIRPRGFITKISSFISSKNIVICEKGALTSTIANNVKNSLINYEPDYIIFQSGINDLLERHPHETILTGQRDLETEIKKKFPESIAYFLPIHPLSLNHQLTKDLPNISSVIANVWNGFERSFLEQDGIHLNARGHTFLSENLLVELSKFM